MIHLIQSLTKIAHACDDAKLFKEADAIDQIIIKIADAYVQFPVSDVDSGKKKIPENLKLIGKNKIHGIDHYVYLRLESTKSGPEAAPQKNLPDLGERVLNRGLPWVAEKLTGQEDMPGLLETFEKNLN